MAYLLLGLGIPALRVLYDVSTVPSPCPGEVGRRGTVTLRMP